MELKVWVEGIQRIVCGVTEKTTCQDVVFALAHATGKVGRFTLIERWRNNERLMAPNENPLKILMKWGEYSSDVQFILQRSDATKPSPQEQIKFDLKSPESPNKLKLDKFIDKASSVSPILQSNINSHVNQKPDMRKNDLTGMVKDLSHSPPASPSSSTTTDNTDASLLLPLSDGKPSLKHISSIMSPILEFNSADIRDSLNRKTNSMSDETSLCSETLHESIKNNNSIDSACEIYKNNPPISSNGALVPPPYRDPPKPHSMSPNQSSTGNVYVHQKSDSQSSSTNSTNGNIYGTTKPLQVKYNFVKEMSPSEMEHMNAISNLQSIVNNATSDTELMNDRHFQTAQCRDLVQLIKYQREKINIQQTDITKYDAEIVYLEKKEREQLQQLDAIAREITKVDQLYRHGNEQLQSLQYIEEENELVRQQEKTLKSEITLLRSKLANCETELLQCKNKIRVLMDDIQIEQRAQQYDGRQLEMHLMHEIERIQNEIDHAIQNSETSSKVNENLKKDVSHIENAVADKKKQLEKLVNELKEVNLQSLTAASAEEIRHLLEGSQRPGSTRRIMGSPRQLETAVPTSKNPHGVWV